MDTRGFPLRWARTTRGVLASRLQTLTSVQTSCRTVSKGPSRAPKHGYAVRCCPCVRSCWAPSKEQPPQRQEDNITPCRQAADRLQVLGQLQNSVRVSASPAFIDFSKTLPAILVSRVLLLKHSAITLPLNINIHIYSDIWKTIFPNQITNQSCCLITNQVGCFLIPF